MPSSARGRRQVNRRADVKACLAAGDGQSTVADLDRFATGGATLLIVEEDPTAG